MKRIPLSLALASLGLAAGAAHAETSVTLYGIADVSIRYLSTSAGSVGQDGSRVSMENGAISNSRWGLRGSEDLGDGNRAFFRLENGFNMQNGRGSDPSKTFSRLAYIGLDGGNIGALTLGLQNTPMFDLLADYFDPLTVGNYDQNAWLPAAMSRVRTNNMTKYSNTIGDLAFVLSWANGDDYKDHKAGQQYGASLRYTVGKLGLGAAYQQTYDGTDSDLRQRVWNLNASYQFDGAKVFAGYYNGRDETGWVNAVMGGNQRPAWTARTMATSPAPPGRPRRAGPSPAPPTTTRARTWSKTATRASATRWSPWPSTRCPSARRSTARSTGTRSTTPPAAKSPARAASSAPQWASATSSDDCPRRTPCASGAVSSRSLPYIPR